MITENASFQILIQRGVWFAAEVRNKKSFGLVGCTVSPAFEFDDFVLANRTILTSQYPAYEAIISKFTRDDSSFKEQINDISYYSTSGMGFYSVTGESGIHENDVEKVKTKMKI